MLEAYVWVLPLTTARIVLARPQSLSGGAICERSTTTTHELINYQIPARIHTDTLTHLHTYTLRTDTHTHRHTPVFGHRSWVPVPPSACTAVEARRASERGVVLHCVVPARTETAHLGRSRCARSSDDMT